MHRNISQMCISISKNALYDSISTLCAQHNITPGKLCSELGISRGIITDLKMGRKKDLHATTACKIAKYFGVSVGYLLGMEDKEENRPDATNIQSGQKKGGKWFTDQHFHLHDNTIEAINQGGN